MQAHRRFGATIAAKAHSGEANVFLREALAFALAKHKRELSKPTVASRSDETLLALDSFAQRGEE